MRISRNVNIAAQHNYTMYCTHQQCTSIPPTSSATVLHLPAVQQYSTYQQCNSIPPTSSATVLHLQAVQQYSTHQQCNSIAPTSSATVFHPPAVQQYSTHQQCNSIPPTSSATVFHPPAVQQYSTHQQCNSILPTSSATVFHPPAVQQYSTHQQCNSIPPTSSATVFHLPAVHQDWFVVVLLAPFHQVLKDPQQCLRVGRQRLGIGPVHDPDVLHLLRRLLRMRQKSIFKRNIYREVYDWCFKLTVTLSNYRYVCHCRFGKGCVTINA